VADAVELAVGRRVVELVLAVHLAVEALDDLLVGHRLGRDVGLDGLGDRQRNHEQESKESEREYDETGHLEAGR